MFKTALGYFFLQLSVVGLVINMLVLVTLIRLMKKSDRQCIHLISIFIMVNDIISLLFDLCYFSPSVISSSYLFADRLDAPIVKIIGSVDTFTWHMSNFLLLLMAANRLAFVVFDVENVFSKGKTLVYMASVSVLSVSIILLDQLVFPSCHYLLDYQRFGYTPLKPENQMKLYDLINFAVEGSFFVVIIIAYVAIFISIYKFNKNVEQSTDSKFHQKIRSRERSYSVQFAYVSFYFMLTYSSFRLLPFILDKDCTDCHVIVPVAYALCCTANASVYISVAQEVRHELFKKIFKNNSVESNFEGGGEPGVPQGMPPDQLQNMF